MSRRVMHDRFLPGGKGNPAPEKTVKGINTRSSSINSALDLRKLNMILRRRHLGILDEQRVTQKTAKSLLFRGIDNYHIEEFVSRSAPGFQCVARKSMDDFTSEYNSKTNSIKYKIILRHVPEFEIDNVVRAMNNIQTKGFLNYYYGSEFMNPHVRKGLLPGLCLLQGQYATAFELLCKAPRVLQQSITNKSQNNENNKIEVLKRSYAESELEHQHSLARELRKHQPIELTDALCRHTLEKVLGNEGCNHLIGEFAAIVWNECVSRRVRLLGSRTICEGDFVVEENNNNTRRKCDDDSDEEQLPVSLQELSKDLFHHHDEERKNNVVDINDTLLPTLGHSTYFSANSEWKLLKTQSLINFGINAMIEEEDLLLSSNQELDEDEDDDFSFAINEGRSLSEAGISCKNLFPSLNFEQPPMWNFCGEYRRMIEYPQNLSWKLIPDIELTEQELGIRTTDRKKNNKKLSSSGKVWQLDEPTERRLLLNGEEHTNTANADDDIEEDATTTSQSQLMETTTTKSKNEKEEDTRESRKQKQLTLRLENKLKSNRPIHGFVIPAKKAGTLHQLQLEFELPAFVSPWMMLREVCKMERYVFDEGMKRSLENREEHQHHVEAEKAAIRRRLYSKIKRKYSWGNKGVGLVGTGSGSVFPDAMDSARLLQSIFHSQGMRGSLMPNPKRPDDVHH